MEYLYITFAILFTSAGQLLQKIAAEKLNPDSNDSIIKDLFSITETWLAIICLSIGMLFWLAVLYMMEVGTAYPFLSINLILVMLMSHYILKEDITKSRVIGSIAILFGILLVTSS